MFPILQLINACMEVLWIAIKIWQFIVLLHFHYSNNIQIVEYLLQSHANPDAVQGAGWTPLHLAAYIGHVGIIECLLNNGANVNKKVI